MEKAILVTWKDDKEEVFLEELNSELTSGWSVKMITALHTDTSFSSRAIVILEK